MVWKITKSFLGFFFTILISCESYNDDNLKLLNSDMSDMVVNINVRNTASPLEFSEISDSLYYIPIKIPNQFPEIAEIYKIKVFDGKIGIFDAFHSALHIINYSGELINVFYVDGSEGHGTFQDVEDFEFLGDTLLLYERSTQVIHKYDIFSKEYFGYLPVDLLFIEFNLFEDKFYIYGDEDRFGLSDPRANKLQIYNKGMDRLTYSSIPYVPGRDEFDTPQRFYEHQDRIYFSELYDDTIYSFRNDKILAEFVIYFGSYDIPAKLLNTNDQDLIGFEFFENKYRGFKHFLIATDEWLSFWYREGIDQKFCFYDKSNDKTFNVSSFIDTKNSGTLPFPMTYDFENKLFLSVIPKEYINYQNKTSNGQSNLSNVYSEGVLNYLLCYKIKDKL